MLAKNNNCHYKYSQNNFQLKYNYVNTKLEKCFFDTFELLLFLHQFYLKFIGNFNNDKNYNYKHSLNNF